MKLNLKHRYRHIATQTKSVTGRIRERMVKKRHHLKKGRDLRIGYAIFNVSTTGKLVGLREHGMSMEWSYEAACVWDTPPKHYFHPENGDFLVKTSRNYDDLEWLGYSNKSNYLFKEIGETHE